MDSNVFGYNFQNTSVENVSINIDKWMLMRTPVPLVLILVSYLYFVLKFGPEWMASRKPFSLKMTIFFYNAAMVLFNIWLVSLIQKVDLVTFVWNQSCKGPWKTADFAFDLHSGAWWYFFSKIIELMDTVFFVLRKKQSQVSFLHVYHHSLTTAMAWAYLKYSAGQQGVFVALLNSYVHVVMYFYYMLAALGPEFKKYLWWKKYITKLQLLQFFLTTAFLSYLILNSCHVSHGATAGFGINGLIYIFLFGKFYNRTYKQSAKPSKNPMTSMNENYSIIEKDKPAVIYGNNAIMGIVKSNNNELSETTRILLKQESLIRERSTTRER